MGHDSSVLLERLDIEIYPRLLDEEMNPIIALTGVRYPKVEEITGKTPEEVRKYLQELYENGVLDVELVERDVGCPKCESINLRQPLICPTCNSLDFKRRKFIEHLTCGNSDFEDKYKTDGRLVCPKCKNELFTGNYRVVGSRYECENGHELNKYDAFKKSIHVCGTCGTQFDPDNYHMIEINKYRFKDSIKEEIRKSLQR